MLVAALTGGIGSGKSTVCRLFADLGAVTLSADQLAREAVAVASPGLAEVLAAFGPELADESGGLDRAKMAKIVFGDPDARRRLEAIIHPRVRERFEEHRKQAAQAGRSLLVYELPLLFEQNLEAEFDTTIAVLSSTTTRLERVSQRDSVAQSDVEARMRNQVDDATRRQRAHHILHNDGDLDELRQQVAALYELLISEP